MKQVLPPVFLMVIVGVIALACVWAQEAWLAPSIAAAAFSQMFTPTQPSGKPYGIALGQAIGAASGFAGVYAAHALDVHRLMGAQDLTYTRVLAIVVAVGIAAIVQTLAQAKSPAGGATAAVVAIGAESATWAGAMRLAVGIAFVTILGEAFRQIILLLEKETPPPSGAPAQTKAV